MRPRSFRTQGTHMGLTHVRATIQSVDKSGIAIEANFLVDTGAIDCLLPASLLRQAGVEPESTRTYELADGQLMEFPVGFARIEFMEEVAIAKVIFGPEDCEPLLGVVALECAGFSVDPVNQTLKHMVSRSLKKLLESALPARSRRVRDVGMDDAQLAESIRGIVQKCPDLLWHVSTTDGHELHGQRRRLERL